MDLFFKIHQRFPSPQQPHNVLLEAPQEGVQQEGVQQEGVTQEGVPQEEVPQLNQPVLK